MVLEIHSFWVMIIDLWQINKALRSLLEIWTFKIRLHLCQTKLFSFLNILGAILWPTPHINFYLNVSRWVLTELNVTKWGLPFQHFRQNSKMLANCQQIVAFQISWNIWEKQIWRDRKCNKVQNCTFWMLMI